MSAPGYQITFSNTGVATIEGNAAAFKALKDAVLNRSYNFGELQIGKDHRLKIINNHKIFSNNTITTSTQNMQVRQAVYDILANNFNSGEKRDVLAHVKTFLCGDKSIASQPLTRDEVANMIKLLSASWKEPGKDEVEAHLRESFALKHGLITDDDVRLRKNMTAGKNRISSNVEQGIKRYQEQQQTDLLAKINLLKPQNNQPVTEETKNEVMNKVWEYCLTRLSKGDKGFNAKLTLFSSLGDHTKLSGSGSPLDFFRSVVENTVRRQFYASEKSANMLMSMAYAKRYSSISGEFKAQVKALGCPPYLFLKDSGAWSRSMKEHLFTKMTKEKALWKQFFVDFEASHQTDVAGKAFRDAIRDGFKMIWGKENRSDPGQRLAQFLKNITSRSFMPLHDSHSEMAFSNSWQRNIDRLVAKFVEGKGDLRGVKGYLKEIKDRVASERETLQAVWNAHGAKIEEDCVSYDNATSILASKNARSDEKQKAQNLLDDFNARGYNPHLKKVEYMSGKRQLDDAETVVNFFERILNRPDGLGTDLMRFLAFERYPFADKIRSDKQDEEAENLIKEFSKGDFGACEDAIKRIFGKDMDDVVKNFLNKSDDIAAKDLDELVSKCSKQLDKFYEEHLEDMSFKNKGEPQANSGSFYGAVRRKSEEMIRHIWKLSLDDLVADAELPQADVQQKAEAKMRLAKVRIEHLTMMHKQFFGGVSDNKSVDSDTAKRLERIYMAFKSVDLTGKDDNDAQLEGLLMKYTKPTSKSKPQDGEKPADDEKTKDKEVKDAQKAVLDGIQEIQDEMNKDVVEGEKFRFAEVVLLLTKAVTFTQSEQKAYGTEKLPLKHVRILLTDVVDAFTDLESKEVNARMLAEVPKACQQEFGMTEDEVRRYVDPEAMAIIARKYPAVPLSAAPTDEQLDRIMQYALTKANSIYKGETNVSEDDRQQAGNFLWKMQNTINLADKCLGQFSGPAKEIVPLTTSTTTGQEVKQKLETYLSNDGGDGSDKTAVMANEVGKALVVRETGDHVFTEVSQTQKKIFLFHYTKEEKVSATGLTLEQKRLGDRIEKSAEFWQRMRMTLLRLERLKQTMTSNEIKFEREPGGLDSDSRMFVEKAKARFGGAGRIVYDDNGGAEGTSENWKLNESLFDNLVVSHVANGNKVFRANFGLSLNFD